MKTIFYAAVGVVVIVLWGCAPETAVDRYDLVVQGGRVMDPESGLDAVRNVGIRDGQIAEISSNPLSAVQIIDATGLVVAPGFIDLHIHSPSEESFRLMVQDGVTTAFELEVGTADISTWYGEREGGQFLNYGVSIGHIPVRMRVMGDEGDFLPSGPGGSRRATQDEIAEMEGLIEEGLEQGAVAVGFGLAYTPAATTAEFESMLQVAADHGASAHIHLRGGMDGLNEAIDTASATGASLHIVHINSSGGGSTAEFLGRIDEARSTGQDVTTEAYPYEAGSSRIESAIYDDWESWEDDRFIMYQWVETGERLTRDSFARYRAQGGRVISHTRTEEMTRTAIESPLTVIASDGGIRDGQGHPRSSGTYSKVLGKYVREDGVLTLMDALRKMTIEPARRLGEYIPSMDRKGRLSLGSDADITIFDSRTVIDQATYTDPTLPSLGIQHVLINGVPVVEDGELVPDVRPGRPARTCDQSTVT